MPMKLIETNVSATTVRMRFEDDAQPVEPEEWVEFEVPLAKLTMGDHQTPMGDPAARRFALIQRAALQRARDVIDDEIQRLAEFVGQRL